MSYTHTRCFDYIYPHFFFRILPNPPLSPTPLPTPPNFMSFFFKKKNNSSNWCCLCTLGCGLIHRNVFDLPGVTQLEKIESPSVCSHQPSMTPQLWLGAHEPLTTPCWNGVAWSCADNQRCCEFVSGVAMACSEDTISPRLCDLSVFYSTMSLCFFRNHRRDLILPYCCSS